MLLLTKSFTLLYRCQKKIHETSSVHGLVLVVYWNTDFTLQSYFIGFYIKLLLLFCHELAGIFIFSKKITLYMC